MTALLLGLLLATLSCASSVEQDDRAARNVAKAVGDCSITMTTSPTYAAQIGSVVTISASATCVGGATAEYKFFVRDPAGAWTMLRDYESSPSFAWSTAGAAKGEWAIQVWVRRTGSADAYEGFAHRAAFTLTTGMVCAITSFNAVPADHLDIPPPAITLSASDNGCVRSYKFFRKTSSGWVVVRDWHWSGRFTFDAVPLEPGTHTFEVWMKSESSTATLEDSRTVDYVLPNPCTGVTLTSSSSSGVPRTSVVFTANATCHRNKEYKFLRREPDGTWTTMRDYAPENTFTWDTTGVAPGSYVFQVWARMVGSPVAFNVGSSNVPYTVIPPPPPCTSATISVTPSSIAARDAIVTFTANAACGSGTPEYRFYRRETTGAWNIAQDYGPSNVLTWNTKGYALGTYTFQVWARSIGSFESWEAVANLPGYVLTDDPGGTCTTATLSAGLPSPQRLNTSIPLTATATCSGRATPLFKLWIQDPAGAWRLLRDWGDGNFTWNGNSTAGNHNLQVWTRAAGSTADYEGFASINPYQLTGCSSVTLTPNIPSPQKAGSIIPLTASATCSGATPEYMLVLPGPSFGPWVSSGAFEWDTTGKGPGTYQLQIWTRGVGSTAAYESWNHLYYTLN